ncbi:30S ribosomal protein S8 [Patescibacteria group bacterium]|nr:30S ribosomal protein S8 [Patescibacteria group bacterium]
MTTDPIADLLTRIRNADKANKKSLLIPYSKIKENICKILKNNEFIKDVKVVKEGKFEEIKVTLSNRDYPINLKRISKPGQRIYLNYKDIKPVLNRLGLSIVSTSKGLMTDKEARIKKIGGEILCEIY